MTPLEETLTPEQKEELAKVGTNNATVLPTEAQEAEVKSALGQVGQRSHGKKHRPSSKPGPITPSEFRDCITSAQTIDDVLGDKRVIDGVFAFIRVENKVGEYQAALGEFVSKYKAFDPDVQKTIRVRLSDGKEIPDRKAIFVATKTGLTSLDELLMILFYDDDSAFEQNANRTLACRKRVKNWLDAYTKAWANEMDAADEKEREKILEKAKHGEATASDLARLVSPVIGKTESGKKRTTTKVDRMTPYSLLADMVLLIGHTALAQSGIGPELPEDERLNLENRIRLLAIVSDARFDASKLDEEINKRRETLNERVVVSADEKAKSDGKDLMDDLKKVVEHREATPAEPVQ